MTTACQTEAHERRIQGKTLLVVNRTPDYRGDERNAVKKAIEQQLYEVFCKYAPNEA